MNRSIIRALPACLVALTLAACEAKNRSPTLSQTDLPAVFIVQGAPATAVMDALFQGRVTLDAQGCLRLENTGDQHTVVWPHGFTLEERGGALFVKDAAGREVGRVGGSFRFGGGETPVLHQGVVSEESRKLAESRCPGRYWIVGEV
ncbi:MAG TPA: hypothetical protein VFS20_12795 [Longimicrobium sp.]|nr:hypothetical protein [Longimicrobium sp.]